MNWFQRYDIVGMFFIVMTGIWFFCLFPDARELLINGNEALPKYIVGFCGLSFLPFGYIIMIFSQLYYYLINRRRRIHCRYWADLPEEKRNKILEKEKDLERFDWNNEAQVEAILTYYDRTKIDSPDINKFLSEFATKRYDVAAINCGLIWAVIFLFIAAICLEGIILDVTIKWNAFSTWFVIILTLSIVSVLYSSERILERQIFEVGRRKLRDMKLD